MCLNFNGNFIGVRRQVFHWHVLFESCWYLPVRGHTKIWVSEGDGVFGFYASHAEDGMPSLKMAERSRRAVVTKDPGACCPSKGEVATFTLLSVFF